LFGDAMTEKQRPFVPGRYDPRTASILTQAVYMLAHKDPGELCPRCRRPYRDWYGLEACGCRGEVPE